jgi:RimJ/RimL family protein N-acetyltransferase
MADLEAITPIVGDEFAGHWSSMADDLTGWLEREMAEGRGPTRAICLEGDDRALGRVAVRLPEFASEAVRCAAVGPADQPAGELSYWLLPSARGRGVASAAVAEMAGVAADLGLVSLVLDIEEGNLGSIRVAERVGAERRSPTRVETDRSGLERTLVVYVLRVR